MGGAGVSESSSVAFGRYLRSVRERHRLSLGDVCALSQGTPHELDKGTLSRFERGQQRIPLATLVPLSRIYGTPPDVLVERLELDQQLEALGGPDTTGLDPEQLVERGRCALLRANRRWESYAYFRAAEALGCTAARLNLVTLARSLGKNVLALHELRDLERSIAPALAPVVHERIANCLRCLGDFTSAERYLRLATDEARALDDTRMLAFTSLSLGVLAFDDGDFALAVEHLDRAFRVTRESNGRASALADNPRLAADILLKLADAHLHAGRIEAAGRAALAAARVALREALPAVAAHAEILLGEVDERLGRIERSLLRWRAASETARELDDRRMAFGAEFYVFRSALRRGQPLLARASRARLDRLLPWVPWHLEVVREYEELRERAGRGEALEPEREKPIES